MINDNKKKIRKRMHELIESRSDEELESLSRNIIERLFRLSLWKNSECILTFLSMRGEVNTEPLISRAVTEGKCIGIPRINGENINFYEIIEHAGALKSEYNSKLKLNKFGIREPVEGLPLIEPAAYPDKRFLVIVPGLGFDREKNRLGRGRGYYDRYISGLKKSAGNFSLLAICFAFQLIDEIPVSNYDEKVDCIVTDTEVIL